MPTRIILLVIITLLSFCTRVIAAPSLSDNEAVSLIEERMNTRKAGVALGNLTVVSQGSGDRVIHTSTYKEILGWEKVGVVAVATDKQYEEFKKGKEFSWSQWNQLTQNSVTAKITVNPSESGKRFVDADNPRSMRISSGKYSVTNVGKNEEQKIGVDYRLVMASLSVEWNPLYKQHEELMGRPVDDRRKAIILFKWDPFTSSWKWDIADFANITEDFNTSYVEERLTRH